MSMRDDVYKISIVKNKDVATHLSRVDSALSKIIKDIYIKANNGEFKHDFYISYEDKDIENDIISSLKLEGFTTMMLRKISKSSGGRFAVFWSKESR